MPTSNEQHQVAVEQRHDVFDRFSVRMGIRDAIADPSAVIGDRYSGEAWTEDEAHWQARAAIKVVRETLNAASTKQAEVTPEIDRALRSAHLRSVEVVAPAISRPPALPVDVAEIVERVRAALNLISAQTWTEVEIRDRALEAAELIERLSASTDRYAQGIEAGYQKGLEDAAAIARKYLLCSGIGDEILALSPDTGRDSGGGR